MLFTYHMWLYVFYSKPSVAGPLPTVAANRALAGEELTSSTTYVQRHRIERGKGLRRRRFFMIPAAGAAAVAVSQKLAPQSDICQWPV